MFLTVLAIVVGLLVVVTRLPGVFAPEASRKMLRFLLERRRLGLATLVIAAGVGGLFIWAFRLYYADHAQVSWIAWALLGWGGLMTILGLIGLAAPNIPFGLWAKLYVTQDSTMRALCVVGVLVGAAIAWLGWALPA